MTARGKVWAVAAAGLLALLCGYQSGAERAQADVGPFGSIYAHSGGSILTTSGEVWQFHGGWWRSPENDPPVPVFDIASWEPSYFITYGGDCWSMYNGWTNYGQVPGGVRVEETSVGAIKAKYGTK